jgi:hypothetical protein
MKPASNQPYGLLVVGLPSTNAAQRRDLGVVNLNTARSAYLSGGRIRQTLTGISA